MLVRPLAALCALATGALAQDSTPARHKASPDSLAVLEHTLGWRTGHVTLQGGMAAFDLPAGFRFLGPKDAQFLLTEIWSNPPDSSVLGIIFPAGATIHDNPYAVVVSYAEDGYVKDDEAKTIDYSKLLTQMQQSVREENPERQKAGYPTVQLLGWADPPNYDAETHKLYWAKRLKFSNYDREVLNYDIRVLGRRGVLVLSMIADMAAIDSVKAGRPEILEATSFTAGNRYADFNEKRGDKVAEYGIAALIAGGIVAKTGLLKGLLAALIAAKKLLIVAAAGVAAWFRRVFGKNKTQTTSPT
jgi:uncharacterized membrane-anchored protein